MAGRKSIDRSVALAEYLPVQADIDEWADIHRPSIYRAIFSSSEVEHFLYLGSDINRHKYLVGKFGFRAAVAENFSIAALTKYGHPNYRLWIATHDCRFGCVINFDLSRASMPTGRPSLRVPLSVGAAELAEHVAVQLSNLLPVIREITTLSRFLNILASDTEPWPWFATNPILRAAQIVAVGSYLNISEHTIREMLVPYRSAICKHLQTPDLDSFLLGLTVDLNGKTGG